MASNRVHGESKIPVLHSNHLKSRLSKPLVSLSNKVRAHIDSSLINHRHSPLSGSSLLNILNSSSSSSSGCCADGKALLKSCEKFSHVLVSEPEEKSSVRRPTSIFPCPSWPEKSTVAALTVGCKVRLVNGKEGVVRYHGETNFGSGLWCGVELDDREEGANLDRVEYVRCADFNGLFVRCEQVTVLPEEVDGREQIQQFISGEVSESGPHSLLGISEDAASGRAAVELPSASLPGSDGKPADGSVENAEDCAAAGRIVCAAAVSSQLSTPTSSSCGEFVPPWDRKLPSSRHSSSVGSLITQKGGTGGSTFPASTDGAPSSSLQMSKHSSIECEDSLGILTPDQMAEFTANCSEGSKASCEDFVSLNLRDSESRTPGHSVHLTEVGANEDPFERTVLAGCENEELLLSAAPGRSSDEHSNRSVLALSETDDMDENSKSSQPGFDEDANRTYSLEELPIDDMMSSSFCTKEDDFLAAAVDQADAATAAGLFVAAGQLLNEQQPATAAIVTSVTSIGSWDNGYQGDGECSRPTSRGAVDAVSPLSAHVSATVKLRVAADGTATDSDFFTESDPDIYEDISSCMSVGDRKARVIDGTLYGSIVKSGGGTGVVGSATGSAAAAGSTATVGSSSSVQRTSRREEGGERAAVAAATVVAAGTVSALSEEMDSSGIYSDDLEKRLEDHVVVTVSSCGEEPVPQEETFSDTSGNSSNKSISSQRKMRIDEPSSRPPDADGGRAIDVPYKNQPIADVSKYKSNGKKSAKTLSGKGSCEDDRTGKLVASTTRKAANRKQATAGKWDAIMSQIEKNRTENKKSSAKLKEVKSKIITTSSSSSSSSRQATTASRDSSLSSRVMFCHRNCPPENRSLLANGNVSSRNTNAARNTKYYRNFTAALFNSTRSLKETSFTNKNRSRKSRGRTGLDSPVSSVIATAPASLSQASTPNSSISDISDSVHHDLSNRSLPIISGTDRAARTLRTSTVSVTGAGSKKVKNDVSTPTIVSQNANNNNNNATVISSIRSSAVRPINHNASIGSITSATTTISSSSTLPKNKTFNKSKATENNPPLTDSAAASAMKVPISKKPSTRRCVTKVVPLKDQNRVIGNGSAVRDHHSTATANKPTNGGKVQNQNFSNLDENSVCCNTKSNKAKTQQQLERSTDDKNASLLRQLKQSNQAMEAFAILLQYLTTDPDVYSLTAIKNQLSHYKMLWRKNKQELEDKIISYRKLEEEFLIHKCSHERKLEHMRTVHSEELAALNEKHKEDLDECAMGYKMKLAELENHFKNQECNLRAEFQRELKAIELKAECKLKKIADEAMRQVELLKNENLTYREKIEEESKRKANQLEKKFVEKERSLLSQLEDLRKEYQIQLKEVSEELRKKDNRPSKREKLLTSDRKPPAITTEKIKPFTTITSFTDDMGNGHRQSQMITVIPPRHQFKNLEDEVCSLRDVLDLKCSEIQDLRKQNEKLKQEVEDLPYITQKLDSSLARIEDLNAQLQTKTNSEQGLLQENRKLAEQLQQETDKKKRLLFQNEELLWKLKRSAQVAKSLAAVSIKKSHYCNCGKENQSSNSTSPGSNNSECNDKKIRRSKTDNNLKFIDSSPVESTPKVLSVVEKSDSVSWVLEIDESPAEVASRMLRRANSLRSTPCQKNSYRHDASVHSHLYTLPTRGKSRHRSSIASKEVVTSADDDSSTTSGIVTSSSGKLSSLVGGKNAACAVGGSMKFRSFSQSDVELSYGKRSFDETLGDGFEDDNLPDISAMFDFLPDSDDMDDNNSIATDQSDHQQQQLLLTRVAANYQLSFSSVDSTSNSDSSLEMDHYTKTIRPLSATSSEDDQNRHHESSLTNACVAGTTSPVVIPKESAGEGLISNVPSENEMAIIVDSSEDTDGEISSTRCVIQDNSSSTTTTGITSRSTLV